MAGKGRRLYRYVFWLFAFVLTVGVLTLSSDWFWRLLYPVPYKQAVVSQAREHGLDPNLVFALCRVESKFNPGAQSRRGALGLMQLMPNTARWIAHQQEIEFQPDLLFQPEYNVRLGCWYLQNLQASFHDLPLVLAAYNAGRGNVGQWLKNNQWDGRVESLDKIPFPETEDFVRRVLKTYRIYQRLYGEES